MTPRLTKREKLRRLRERRKARRLIAAGWRYIRNPNSPAHHMWESPAMRRRRRQEHDQD